MCIYIYIYMYVCVCIYIYIYIYNRMHIDLNAILFYFGLEDLWKKVWSQSKPDWKESI